MTTRPRCWPRTQVRAKHPGNLRIVVGTIIPLLATTLAFGADTHPRPVRILTLDQAANLLGLDPEDVRTPGSARATRRTPHRVPTRSRERMAAKVARFRDTFGERATVLRTRHYVILTTLGAEWAELIGPEMDAMFGEYQKRLGFGKRISERFIIRVYGDQGEYLASGGEPGYGGHFSPHSGEIVAFLDDASALRPALYHEGVHQFVHFHVRHAPVWFNEGLARYYESAMPDPDAGPTDAPRFIVGRALLASSAHLKRELGYDGLVPLAHLLRMKPAEFYQVDTSLHYAQAWAFTHFLLESGDAARRKLWDDYFRALRDGLSQEAANLRIFDRVDMTELEQDFKDYVRDLDGWIETK